MTADRHISSKFRDQNKIIPCELALLAMGFVHPQQEGLINDLGVELDERGNVKSS